MSPKLRGMQIVRRKQQQPRSLIMATQELKMWAIDNFCDRDLVVARWETGVPKQPSIVVASLYAPIE